MSSLGSRSVQFYVQTLVFRLISVSNLLLRVYSRIYVIWSRFIWNLRHSSSIIGLFCFNFPSLFRCVVKGCLSPNKRVYPLIWILILHRRTFLNLNSPHSAPEVWSSFPECRVSGRGLVDRDYTRRRGVCLERHRKKNRIRIHLYLYVPYIW